MEPLVGAGNTYVLSLRDEELVQLVVQLVLHKQNQQVLKSVLLEFMTSDLSLVHITLQTAISMSGMSHLFDIQTVTKITLNENTTLTAPLFVEGKNSGSTGFLKNSITDSNVIELYETSGEFTRFEGFKFDGIDNGRVATAITAYGISVMFSQYMVKLV